MINHSYGQKVFMVTRHISVQKYVNDYYLILEPNFIYRNLMEACRKMTTLSLQKINRIFRQEV